MMMNRRKEGSGRNKSRVKKERNGKKIESKKKTQGRTRIEAGNSGK